MLVYTYREGMASCTDIVAAAALLVIDKDVMLWYVHVHDAHLFQSCFSRRTTAWVAFSECLGALVCQTTAP